MIGHGREDRVGSALRHVGESAAETRLGYSDTTTNRRPCTRDLALFNIAIDSKLRGCDVVGLKVEDVAPHGYTMDRATIRQQKTGRPVRFEITEQRVRGFRKHHDITTHRDGEWAERGEITLDAAAEIIGVCKMTALRMLRRGDLKGRQVCAGAPWVIKVEYVSAFAARKRSSSPVTPNPAQQTFEFQ
jgi:integrase